MQTVEQPEIVKRATSKKVSAPRDQAFELSRSSRTPSLRGASASPLRSRRRESLPSSSPSMGFCEGFYSYSVDDRKQ